MFYNTFVVESTIPLLIIRTSVFLWNAIHQNHKKYGKKWMFRKNSAKKHNFFKVKEGRNASCEKVCICRKINIAYLRLCQKYWKCDKKGMFLKTYAMENVGSINECRICYVKILMFCWLIKDLLFIWSITRLSHCQN